jgi:hypothetical protein
MKDIGQNGKYNFFVLWKNLAASVWLYVTWFPNYGSSWVFIRCRVSVYQSITSYVRLLLFCFFFVLGCRYPGQSPEDLQLRWCFLLFRLLVIDHVYNRVKHGNVTQFDTVPVDNLFLTIFCLAYLRTLTLSRWLAWLTTSLTSWFLPTSPIR